MINEQLMFNQINAIISLLPENEKKVLSPKFVLYFKEHANCEPEEALDFSKPLKEQELTDETLLMLYHLNNMLKEKLK